MKPRDLIVTFLLLLSCSAATFAAAPPKAPPDFRHCAGTYSGAPRPPDGHVDIALLLKQLGELHADTYNWLIWTSPHDWDDLQAFLPKADAQHIRVWVSLVPPSESP